MIVDMNEAYIALTDCVFIHQVKTEKIEVGYQQKYSRCIGRLRRDPRDERMRFVDDNRHEREGVGGTAIDANTN